MAKKKPLPKNKPVKVVPAGKPESWSMADYVKSCLNIVDPNTGKSTRDMILASQAEMAIAGETESAKFLFDRAYGKPIETVNNTGTLQHNHTITGFTIKEVKA